MSEEEAQGAALAAKFEDPEAALKALLGPELTPLGAGSGPLSAQVRAVTEHRYTPDRYMYREGMALAARLEKEEKAAEAAGHNSASPATPIQLVGAPVKTVAGSMRVMGLLLQCPHKVSVDVFCSVGWFRHLVADLCSLSMYPSTRCWTTCARLSPAVLSLRLPSAPLTPLTPSTLWPRSRSVSGSEGSKFS